MIRFRSNISATQLISRASFVVMLVLREQVFPEYHCSDDVQPFSRSGAVRPGKTRHLLHDLRAPRAKHPG